ncbi:hypothetical protein PRK78_003574 [Emydomyces testavorans]|uniref:Serine/threonine-protein kinase ATG1 n=1 Tax=Emydomyces testavorans TaxID=2070801 RepID=A0AAF0IIN6_9EURO|nr:hypothetical protein PRK78_003574 [Emydomyces testavorans]
MIVQHENKLALDIGFHICSHSSNTLATLGRGENADIFIDGSSISRIQCSFEVNYDSGVVMLYDRSNAQSTQVFGDNVVPFEHGRPRRVVVSDEINTTLGMGGVGCNLVLFQFKWHQGFSQTMDRIKASHGLMNHVQADHLRLAPTVDDVLSDVPSQRVTRIHTMGERQPKIKYVTIELIATGAFGSVYKALNLYTGSLMAVKTLPGSFSKMESSPQGSQQYKALKREIETLSRLSHPNIIDYIASQGWEDGQVEIFMGLKEGNVETLIESGKANPLEIADSIFQQMLEALDFLDFNGLVHRDVKPPNILFTSRSDGQYLFQLTDFGLANSVISARTYAGSPLFMAPEMFHGGPQTSKVDMWSFYVTMLWILNVNQFRDRCNSFKTIEETLEEISKTSTTERMSGIREMAVLDPSLRASAAQMLVKHFKGQGLVSPRNKIPPLEASSGRRLPLRLNVSEENQRMPRSQHYGQQIGNRRLRSQSALREI